MKFTRVTGLLLVVLALVLAACGDTPTEPAPTKSATTATSTTTAATTTAAPTPTTAVATTTIAPVPTATKIPTTTVAATTAASVNSKAIRSTDWLAVFKADPTLTLSKGPNNSTYIESKTDKWGGVAILDRIEYADLDVDTAGTGPEEAIISLDSTGTAGVINFLVYRYATPFPKLVARQDGYKLYVKPVTANSIGIDVQRALYGPTTPNCCPIAFGIDHYVLKNDKLTVATSSVQYIPESTKQFVDDYYTLLNDRKFEQAYALHSKDFQIKNPYKQWAAGYANTKSIKAIVAPDKSGANVVQVNLAATESSSGGTKTTNYTGTWSLIWDEQAQDLRMNQGSFK